MKTTNPFKAVLIAFILLVTSIIMKWITTAISIAVVPIIYLVTLRWKSGALQFANWMFNIALSNDQHGNVVSSDTLKYLLTKKGRHEFGDPDDTVSYVIARNKYKGKLTNFGKAMGKMLNTIDPKEGGHLYSSIQKKIEADKEALIRLKNNKYYE